MRSLQIFRQKNVYVYNFLTFRLARSFYLNILTDIKKETGFRYSASLMKFQLQTLQCKFQALKYKFQALKHKFQALKQKIDS